MGSEAGTPQPSSSDAAGGWLTFDDPAAPFTLRYPEDVLLTYGQSKAGVYTTRLQFRLPGVDGYQGMLIRVEPNAEGRDLENVLADLYRRYNEGEPPGALLADAQHRIVSGQAGVQINTGGGEDFSIVLPYGGRVYIIAPVHDMSTATADPAALALFREVLATLEVR